MNSRTRRSPTSRLALLAALALTACTGTTVAVDGRTDAGEPDAGCSGQLCGTACVDLQTDPGNCGGCGVDCAALPGVDAKAAKCAAGACVTAGACQAGRGDCNGDPADGCERDLTVASDCGVCGRACEEPTPFCSDGTSGYACASGCGGATSTRCGTRCLDARSDPASCGACDNACPAPANASALCENGACGFRCNPGFHRCGDTCVSDTDVAHCGSACAPCAPPVNATATCDGVRCGFACDAGFHLCGSSCVSDLDVAHCGGGCTPCPAPANGTATCNGQRCGFSCDPGYHACGGACAGDHDVASCGASCTPCVAPAKATATCDGTRCG
ncbi:MAG: hypothetical protein ACK4N5_23380, partial [Myxococcales bacterium]